jgi:hypothetical protein
MKKYFAILLITFAVTRVMAQADETVKTVDAQAAAKAALHAELKKFEGTWTNRKYCYAEPRIIYEIKIDENNKIYGTSGANVNGKVYESNIIGKYINGKLLFKECYEVLNQGTEEPICPKYTDYNHALFFNKAHDSLLGMSKGEYDKSYSMSGFKYKKTTDAEIRKTNRIDCPKKD